MHSPTNEQKENFARTLAGRLGVTARTVRKARAGHPSAYSRLLAAHKSFVLGRSLTMGEMTAKKNSESGA